MSEYRPHAYQREATRRIIEGSAVGLFLDMGLGKTVATLTAIQELMHDRFEVRRCLVIAPLRVAKYTWPAEVAKWEHLRLRVSPILGDKKARRSAVAKAADIYTINRENVPWLCAEYGRRWPFDMVVIDESSSFKNPKSKRFRALRRVRPLIDRLVLLTGTPAPQSLMDLWPQLYLLDGGARLGRTLTAFRDRWFRPGKRNGHIVYQWDEREGAAREIGEAIEDICLSMKAADWLDLPERIDNRVSVELPPAARAAYDKLVRDFIAELDGGEVTAANSAVLAGKLLQLSNGAAYTEDGRAVPVHDAKIDALRELTETGEPLIVYYWFRHDLARIMQAIPDARTLDDETTLREWNEGRVPVLLLHPASAGHGLNLQAGGHTIVWFGQTWSLELYQQANARLHRQGQTRSVIVHHIVAAGTMDEAVLRALRSKRQTQDALIEAVKAEIGGVKK